MEISDPLVIVDSQGQPRIILGIFNNIPSLCILDHDGCQRISLGLNSHGDSHIAFSDKSGCPRLSFGIRDKECGMYIQNASGEQNISIMMSDCHNYPEDVPVPEKK